MKKILFLSATLLIFGVFKIASAGTFEVHLYYDKDKDVLSFDKKVVPPVVFDQEKVTSIPNFDEKYANPGPYEILFLDSEGVPVDQKQFTPQEGAFVIEVPDYHISRTVAIRRTSSPDFLAQENIGQYISCNNDGICEIEKGENFNTCLPDCASGHVQYSEQTLQQLDANKGSIIDPKTGEVILRDLRSVQTESTVDTSGAQQDQANAQPEQSSNTKQWVAIGFVALLVAGIIAGALYYVAKKRSEKFGI